MDAALQRFRQYLNRRLSSLHTFFEYLAGEHPTNHVWSTMENARWHS